MGSIQAYDQYTTNLSLIAVPVVRYDVAFDTCQRQAKNAWQ
jgi:hypothetical protein